MTERLSFAAPAARIDWPARMAQKLDPLPRDGWTAAQDLRLMEAVMAGKPVARVGGLPDKPGVRTVRCMAIQDCIRDDAGILSLDGRAALLAELRRRAG